MTLARHCDGPDCDTWQRAVTDLPDHWMTITDAASQHHFCQPWCAVRWLSGFAEPPDQGDL